MSTQGRGRSDGEQNSVQSRIVSTSHDIYFFFYLVYVVLKRNIDRTSGRRSRQQQLWTTNDRIKSFEFLQSTKFNGYNMRRASHQYASQTLDPDADTEADQVLYTAQEAAPRVPPEETQFFAGGNSRDHRRLETALQNNLHVQCLTHKECSK